MGRLVWGSLLLIAVFGVQARNVEASFCGLGRHCLWEAPRCCKQCCPQYCTVMVACREIVYDEVEQIAYNVVYKEVKDPKKVKAIEYVPDKAYHCVCTTVLQPKPVCGCAAAPACAPACAPAYTSDLAPVNVCRKYPYPTFQTKEVEKEVVTTRITAEEVPYKFTACIPRVVIKMVPVQICCPVPCCRCETGCN